jgi:Glycosyl-4,4'-diaponeurosporenoate acyltransferase
VARATHHHPRRVSIQAAILCGLLGMVALLCWLVVLLVAWRAAADVEFATWFALLIFALVINCMVTASIWFADSFARFSLPPAYYEIKAFEKNGRLYELLGVRAARRVFRHSPAVRFSGRRGLLPKLELDMRLAETHHVLSLIIIVPVSICFLLVGQLSLALGLLLSGVVFQVYPIILQRYNRGRLLKFRALNRHVAHAA